MEKHPNLWSAYMTIEVSRTAAGDLRMILTLPGREGTTERVWRSPVPWEDVQAAVLGTLSDYLWVSGGVTQRLEL